jgi:hypothetical protein
MGMKSTPGNMLKRVRDLARTSRPAGPLSVVDGPAPGSAGTGGAAPDAAVRIPAQAAVTGGFREGDRVMLVRPCWGELDPSTGVMVKNWNGAATGEPPTFAARSQGTVIYPHPAPDDFVSEMRAKGNYLVLMDNGQKLYSCNSSPQPWINTDLKRIPGQCQVTYQNGQISIRPKFNHLDWVQLRESFTCRNDGKRYEAGWRGKIVPLTATVAECWDTGLYEVVLDDDPVHGSRGTVTVYAEALVLLRPGPARP